ncbi:MAG: hypothetical protein ACLFOZ_12455 [Cyclobacteriaceae bacterium]
MLKLSNLFFIALFSIYILACNTQQQDTPGEEVEEADETPEDTSKVEAYDPSDTVLNVNKADINDRLKDHAMVVVITYLEMGEALMQDDMEAAKARAEQLREIMERSEHEDMDLQEQVKTLYTNSAHVMQQSTRIILSANDALTIRSAYSPMATAAYKLAKIADFKDENLYYQYCPQAFDGRGAYWLSRTEEANNPYDEGNELQNCGEMVGKI